MLSLIELGHTLRDICELSDRIVFLLFSFLKPLYHKPVKMKLEELPYSEIFLDALDLEGLGLL